MSESEESTFKNTESSIFKYIIPNQKYINNDNNVYPRMYKINFVFSYLIFVIFLYIIIKKYYTNLNNIHLL